MWPVLLREADTQSTMGPLLLYLNTLEKKHPGWILFLINYPFIRVYLYSPGQKSKLRVIFFLNIDNRNIQILRLNFNRCKGYQSLEIHVSN